MKVISADTGYLFETTFDLSPVPTILMDKNFNILKTNSVFRQTFTLDNSIVQGENLFALLGLQKEEAKQVITYFDSSSTFDHAICNGILILFIKR